MKIKFTMPSANLFSFNTNTRELRFNDLAEFVHWVEAISKQIQPTTGLYIEVKTTKMS